MTVSTTAARVDYTGVGVAGPFPIPFQWSADADLLVIKTELATGIQINLFSGADFTTVGAGTGAPGSLTLTAVLTASYRLSIIRDPQPTQQTDYVPNDKFPAQSHELALDKLTMLVQRLYEIEGRSIKFPEGESLLAGFLPPIVSRAGKFLGFDGAGLPTVLPGTTSVPDASLITYTATSTGAVPRSILSKARDFISVADYGAKGDYNPATGVGTDDAPAIQRAIDAAYGCGGGEVWLEKEINGSAARYKLGSQLFIWEGVTLRGPHANIQSGFRAHPAYVPVPGTNPEVAGGRKFRNMYGSLWVCFDAGRGDGTGTYNVTSAIGLPNYATRTAAIYVRGCLTGCYVFQASYDNGKDATYTGNATWNSAWNSGNMSGLAIRQDAEDARVETCFIGGFMQAILSNDEPRGRFWGLTIDCMNGIEVTASGDTHSIKDIHGWPFCVNGTSGSSLVRRGAGIYLHDTADGTRLTDCFFYGWKEAFNLTNVNYVQAVNCQADNALSEDWVNYIGFHVVGASDQNTFTNCWAAGRQWGFKLEHNAGLHAILNGCQVNYVNHGVDNAGNGNATVIGGKFTGYNSGGFATSYGFGNGGTGRLRVVGMPTMNTWDVPFSGDVIRDFGPFVTVGGAYAMTAGDAGVYAQVPGNWTLTLPKVGSHNGTSWSVDIWRDAQAGVLTIQPLSGQIIMPDGSFVASFSLAGGAAGYTRLVSDGATNWLVSTIRTSGQSAPAPLATVGAFTSASCTVNFKRRENNIFCHIDVPITTNGTAAGLVKIPLPFAPTAQTPLSGVEVAHGKALTGYFNTDGYAYIFNYDATYPGADGNRLIVSGELRI